MRSISRPRAGRRGLRPFRQGGERGLGFSGAAYALKSAQDCSQTCTLSARGDLQERAILIEEQIASVGIEFERTVEQLKRKLKAELAALGVAMLAEHYRTFLIRSFDCEQ
jgi:hypothetical protein